MRAKFRDRVRDWLHQHGPEDLTPDRRAYFAGLVAWRQRDCHSRGQAEPFEHSEAWAFALIGTEAVAQEAEHDDA